MWAYRLNCQKMCLGESQLEGTLVMVQDCSTTIVCLNLHVLLAQQHALSPTAELSMFKSHTYLPSQFMQQQQATFNCSTCRFRN